MIKFVKAKYEHNPEKEKILIEQINQLHGISKTQAKKTIRDVLNNEEVFMNDKYQVSVRKCKAVVGWPEMIHLSIKTLDKSTEHDWREFQEIKNQLVGEECEGVELYPAESRKVDAANQYHMFCIKDSAVRFPFGFTERLVGSESLASGKQRPL